MDTTPSPHTPAVRFLAIWTAVITLALIGGVIRIWPMAAAGFAHQEKEFAQPAPKANASTTGPGNGGSSTIPAPERPASSTPSQPEAGAKTPEAADRAAKAAEDAKASATQALEASEQTKKTAAEALKSIEKATKISAAALPLGPEGTILILILLLGAAGAQIHAVQSFADFVGNGSFTSRWLIWYVKRPAIGALLALTVYAVVGGGVTGIVATFGNAKGTLWGLTAICLLSGMFSRLVTDKLYEVFATLLAANVSRNDGMKDNSSATKSVLSRLEPATVSTAAPVPVKISGKNFTKPSKVRISDQELDIKFSSDTELELPAASLPTKPGSYGITVIDGTTKSQSSPAVELEITA